MLFLPPLHVHRVGEEVPGKHQEQTLLSSTKGSPTGRMVWALLASIWQAVAIIKQWQRCMSWLKTMVNSWALSMSEIRPKTEVEAYKAHVAKKLNYNCAFSCHGLALRGHTNGEDSNFTHLLHLWAFYCPEVTTWMDKETNKYMSADIQNECLQVMALDDQALDLISQATHSTGTRNNCLLIQQERITIRSSIVKWYHSIYMYNDDLKASELSVQL